MTIEPFSIQQIITLGAALQIGGPILAVLVIWWFDRRDLQKTIAIVVKSHEANKEALSAYREDTKIMISAHQLEMRRVVEVFEKKYDNNIILVKSIEKIASDQKDVIITNTQALTSLKNNLKYNRLCPNVKVDMGD